jgi:DNA repair exonuclease SbcCD ATPase subunit
MYPRWFFLLSVYGMKSLVGKMQVNDARYHMVERKEKVEAALARLKSLKCQVSELRAQCEALKNQQSKKQEEAVVCSECGKPIGQGEEVTLRDSLGKVKRRYHRDCFKAIWLSQTWIFDYSCPGFLRMSESDR